MPKKAKFSIENAFLDGEMDVSDGDGEWYTLKRTEDEPGEAGISLVAFDSVHRGMRGRFGGDRPIPDEVVEAIVGKRSKLDRAALAFASELVKQVAEYRSYLRMMAGEKSAELKGELAAEADEIRAKVNELVSERGRFADADDLNRKVTEAYEAAMRRRLRESQELRGQFLTKAMEAKQISDPLSFPEYAARLFTLGVDGEIEAILEYLIMNDLLEQS